MMAAHGENEMAGRKPDNLSNHGMEGWKLTNQLGNSRRALREINNYVGAAPFPPAISKKRLSEKPHLESRIKHFAGHRPDTRRYAASPANKQVHVEESNCRPEVIRNEERLGMDLSVQTSTGLENLVIEVDHDMVVSDFPLPPYVKQTEDILEEEEEMEEMEMENVDVEVPEIDRADKEDTLAVVEYVEDIYSYYRQAEASSCVSPGYMSNQSDINEKMRAILIDWLIEVHHKFELMDETLFLMVNLIDRFLESYQVVRKKLQLVGVTAMLLACKYEEVTVPVIEDLILISDRAYSRVEVLEMEKLIVNTLQFNISVPTPYVFMRRFLKAAESDKKLELLSFFMIELCLVEYGMLNYPPSLLAASAVYTAQCTVNRFRYWSKTSERHTKYTEDQLLECSKLMVQCHKKSANGKLTGVYRKYSTAMLGYAAKAEPAEFLQNTRL